MNVKIRREKCVCASDGGSLSCEKKSWGLSEGDESFEGGASEKSGSRLK